ncbi:hypothetical protein BJ508DRAFT_366216 [Ascobolus immersus RN42]|uniref:Spindle pole body component n=1 Tax=Ascobolus immersus RN42 TaxID=1160509 RepID=A0A3N4HKT2_ASCIM|nr:hypothetical protein BJ508DRAFT_366216 [Ascobolus immersus RN42]
MTTMPKRTRTESQLDSDEAELPPKSQFRQLFDRAKEPVDAGKDAYFTAAFQFPRLWEPSKLMSGEVSGGESLFGEFYKGPELLFTHELDRLTPALGKDEGTLFNWPVPSLYIDSSPEASSTASSQPQTGEQTNDKREEQEEEEDYWAEGSTWEVTRPPRFYTWDTFAREEARDQRSGYLTEAGSGAFDAVLKRWGGGGAGEVFRSDVFCTCVRYLGMGISSILFSYDETERTFVQRRKEIRVSGLTVEATESFTSLFLQTGTHLRALHAFTQKVRRTPTSPSTLLALANVATTIISALRYHLTSFPSTTSLLALQSHLETPFQILTTFLALIRALRHTSGETQLLTKLWEICLENEHKSTFVLPFLLAVFERVSRPFVEWVEEWVGFRASATELVGGGTAKVGRYFVGVEEEEGKEGKYVLKREEVPGWVSWEEAVVVFETGKSLRYLWRREPAHPVCRPVEEVGLGWRWGWEDVERLHQQAKEYERNLLEAINTYMKPRPPSAASLGDVSMKDATDVSMMDVDEDSYYAGEDAETRQDLLPQTVEQIEQAAIDTLHQAIVSTDAPPPPLPPTDDPLYTFILTTCSSPSPSPSQTFAPPLTLTPALSFTPLLQTQHRLLNAITLRLFFTSHHITAHLALLSRFFLFKDGIYTARLSHALFSPDADAADRHLNRTGKVLGNLGLRLGGRRGWPPASYEVRLALLNVLSDSMSAAKVSTPLTENVEEGEILGDLPGGLSFAIRELEEEELKRCSDARRIEALDFLKLDYRPPEPLGEVITAVCVERYDRIFKLLLRLLRMQHVLKTLTGHTLAERAASRHVLHPRRVGPAHRPEGGEILDRELRELKLKFRQEATHLLTHLTSYFTTTATLTPHTAFLTSVSSLEADLVSEDEVRPREEGLHTLRARHEKVLDAMLENCFLKQRQAPVMQLLESILDLILDFSYRFSPPPEEGKGAEEVAGKIKELEELTRVYRGFGRKVRVFCSIVRGLAAEGRSRSGKVGGAKEEGPVSGAEGLARLVGEVEGGGWGEGGGGGGGGGGGKRGGGGVGG